MDTRVRTTPCWISILVFSALLCLTATGWAADPVKLGPEIEVFGAGDDAYAYRPRIGVDPGGSFLIAWYDTEPLDYEMRGRAFWANGNPRGPMFTMSEPHLEAGPGGFDDDYELASVAADGAGNFLVAYNANVIFGFTEPACLEDACIVTKRYESTGKLSSASFIVGDPRLFPYEEPRNQTANPELAADGEGNFIVAWEGYDLSPGGYVDSEGVWARRLVSVGQVNGSQFRVNELTDEYQGDGGQLDVAADAAGNFVLVWNDYNDYAAPPYGGIVFRRFDKAKNPIGAQTQVTDHDGDSPDVAQAPTGEFLVVWQDETLGVAAQAFDADGIAASPAFQVAADGSYAEVAASGAGTFIVVYNGGGGPAGKTFAIDGTPTSSEFTFGSIGYYPSVAADVQGNFVVTWSAGDAAFVQRFQAVTPTPQTIPVLGKVAVVKNKDPDEFEKSSGKWKASGDEIVSPLRGGANDPRCNGDPDGTVKASVRFVSATSGQDHTFPLPCENWSVTGGNKVSGVAKRGYKYSDAKREDGPCNAVKIKGTKSISVTCKGKPGAASFPYDLVSGQSQGVIQTVLATGLISHCAEFQGLIDGSDGKTYKGKAVAPPASCP